MNAETLIAAVTLVAILISLLLAAFLLSVKTEKKLSNRLFAAFLILNAIDIFGVIATAETPFLEKINVFRSMMVFLHLPVFYLYISSVCYVDFRMKAKDLLHTTPFLLVICFLLPTYFLLNQESNQSVIDSRQQLYFSRFVFAFLHVQVFVYLLLCFRMLLKARRLYVENYAGEQIEAYKWLFQLTTALAIFYAIALVKNITKFSADSDLSDWVRIGLLVFELIVLCGYLFKALSKPALFRGIDSSLKLVENSTESEVVSTNAELTKLQNYMEVEKPHLNPEVTIQHIADGVEIPVRDLSLLINRQAGKHFFDFINEYRIEEAKRILADPEKQRLTVLEILYEVGFNSKSSFNTAFKKHTGVTPTSYRKSLMVS